MELVHRLGEAETELAGGPLELFLASVGSCKQDHVGADGALGDLACADRCLKSDLLQLGVALGDVGRLVRLHEFVAEDDTGEILEVAIVLESFVHVSAEHAADAITRQAKRLGEAEYHGLDVGVSVELEGDRGLGATQVREIEDHIGLGVLGAHELEPVLQLRPRLPIDGGRIGGDEGVFFTGNAARGSLDSTLMLDQALPGRVRELTIAFVVALEDVDRFVAAHDDVERFGSACCRIGKGEGALADARVAPGSPAIEERGVHLDLRALVRLHEEIVSPVLPELVLDRHDFIPIQGVDRAGDVVQVERLADLHGYLLLKGANGG